MTHSQPSPPDFAGGRVASQVTRLLDLLVQY